MKKQESPQYAISASPEITIKCGRCEQEFKHSKPSKVRGYRIVLQSVDRALEYAAARPFFCDQCVDEVRVEIEKLICATMEINSPLTKLRILGCEELDAHNEAVRVAVDKTQIYKSHNFLANDLPQMPNTKIELHFPQPKRRWFRSFRRKIGMMIGDF